MDIKKIILEEMDDFEWMRGKSPWIESLEVIFKTEQLDNPKIALDVYSLLKGYRVRELYQIVVGENPSSWWWRSKTDKEILDSLESFKWRTIGVIKSKHPGIHSQYLDRKFLERNSLRYRY